MYSINYWRSATEITRSTNQIEARIARLELQLARAPVPDPAMQKELAALKSQVQPIGT